MPHEDSEYAEDWRRIAEKDLTRVDRLLEGGDPEAAGFYLQQGLEKLLKAYLLARGWRLQRTHDLEALLNEVVRHDPGLEEYRAVCQRISAYYMVERYPLVPGIALTRGEVASALEAASGLVDALLA